MKEQLEKFAELVAEWGSKMNLVSVPKKDAVMSEHIDDCVRAYERLEAILGAETLSVLPVVDIGSGAGFPGIVWAIINPEVPVYLVEPRDKREIFLRHAAHKLGLKRIRVICSRFEDLPRAELPRRCLFTSRAVGYDADLVSAMIKEVRDSDAIWAVMSGPQSIEKLVNSTRGVFSEGRGRAEKLGYQLDNEQGMRYLFLVTSGGLNL